MCNIRRSMVAHRAVALRTMAAKADEGAMNTYAQVIPFIAVPRDSSSRLLVLAWT
jgi:hypothetical protein